MTEWSNPGFRRSSENDQSHVLVSRRFHVSQVLQYFSTSREYLYLRGKFFSLSDLIGWPPSSRGLIITDDSESFRFGILFCTLNQRTVKGRGLIPLFASSSSNDHSNSSLERNKFSAKFRHQKLKGPGKEEFLRLIHMQLGILILPDR